MKAHAEYERKLDAPVGFELPALGGRPLEPRSFTSVYYDVPGGSLAASGITLRRRTEHGRSVWQLKLPSEGFRLELAEPGGPAHVPESMTRLLRTHLRRGPLARVAELRTRRTGELVTRDESRAEVTLDQVSIMDASRVRERFVEVEIELRSGDPQHLDLVARDLRKAGARRGDETPKLFRALAPVEEPRGDGPAAVEALRAGLLRQLRAIEAQDPGTRLGRDPESLHAMRVAVRRARALFGTARRVIADDTEALETGLKELGGELGDVRDLDVLIERFRAEAEELDGDAEKDFRAAIASLTRERAAARRRLLRALDSDRYFRLLDDLERTARERDPERRRLDVGGSRRSPGGQAPQDREVAPERAGRRRAACAAKGGQADAVRGRARRERKAREAREGAAGRARRAPGRGSRGRAPARARSRGRHGAGLRGRAHRRARGGAAARGSSALAECVAAAEEGAVSVLLRHASAGDRYLWAGDDRLRPLDEKGRRQAEKIAKKLAGEDVRRIVSSPYARCVQTVEPLAAALGLEVELDDRLAEGGGGAARALFEEPGVVACTHGDVIFELIGARPEEGRVRRALGRERLERGEHGSLADPAAADVQRDAEQRLDLCEQREAGGNDLGAGAIDVVRAG